MAHDPITALEAVNALANGNDLARDVLAEDGWVVEGEEGHVLEVAVDGVDGYGMVADEDLVGFGGPEGDGLDLEGVGFGGGDDGGGVGGDVGTHFGEEVVRRLRWSGDQCENAR